MLIDKPFSRVLVTIQLLIKIWNLTNEIHLGKKILKKTGKTLFFSKGTRGEERWGRETVVMPPKQTKRAKSVMDKRNTRNEKNDQTERERNTADDMDESRADGDDDDEGGNSRV
jgi:hypothetical protein